MPSPRRQRDGDVDLMLKRAEADKRERRYIYSGDSPSGATKRPGGTRRPGGINEPDAASGSTPSVTPLRSNRRVVRRRISTSNVMLTIFAIGIAIVLYVNNIITVNRLAREVNELQQTYDRLRSSNAALQAEVNRKSAMERIGEVASKELGLRHPAEKPVEFPVDEEALETLKARQARP
jgi:cell division protein FtsL